MWYDAKVQLRPFREVQTRNVLTHVKDLSGRMLAKGKLNQEGPCYSYLILGSADQLVACGHEGGGVAAD